MGSVPARLGDPLLGQAYVRPCRNATLREEERAVPAFAPRPISAPASTFRTPAQPKGEYRPPLGRRGEEAPAARARGAPQLALGPRRGGRRLGLLLVGHGLVGARARQADPSGRRVDPPPLGLDGVADLDHLLGAVHLVVGQ